MIKCICIDDSGRPDVIPISHWVKKDQEYTINYVYKMVLQGGILGVALNEIDLTSLNIGYDCFKITRFAIDIKDLKAFVELAKDCKELGDLDFQTMIEEQLVLIEN